MAELRLLTYGGSPRVFINCDFHPKAWHNDQTMSRDSWGNRVAFSIRHPYTSLRAVGCAAVRVLSVNCFRMPTFQTKTGRL